MEFHHPVITAHSGCGNTPLNSIKYPRMAVAVGAEMDLVLLSYGIPILMHDPPERSSKPRSRIVTLDEALDYGRPRKIMLNLDLKDDESIDAVVSAVCTHALADGTVITDCH